MKLNLPPAEQLVVVLAESWSAVPARLFCFDKIGTVWQLINRPIDAVVGNNGMAWGHGFNEHAQSDPVKKEGDRKAPAGVFRLIKAMGYAETAPDGSAFPYERISESHCCVDDPASGKYNRIVNTADPNSEITWNSAEVMKRTDDLYKWLVVVDYNKEQPVPGAGSCIFIHVWRSKDEGTTGCTAMAEKDMITLLAWLKPELNPMLVQMPGPEYERRRIEWNLPDMEK
jgi:L,D-peptidoglycan transpeptidase YkuD (ErfK/YbiS/YcfS/YnhG family)